MRVEVALNVAKIWIPSGYKIKQGQIQYPRFPKTGRNACVCSGISALLDGMLVIAQNDRSDQYLFDFVKRFKCLAITTA